MKVPSSCGLSQSRWGRLTVFLGDCSAGAISWIQLESASVTEVQNIELSGGAQLLINGTKLTVDNFYDDGTCKLYVPPSQKLQINSVLSPCVTVFHGGELILSSSTFKVSVERSVSMYGTLVLEDNLKLSIGKHAGVFTMFPGATPQHLEVAELTVESTGSLRLANYGEFSSPAPCQWSLGGKLFSFMADSSVIVSCPLNMTGDQLSMGQNSRFEIYGNGSVSTVSMKDVWIDGTFHPQLLSVGFGWEKLQVSQNGELRFASYGDLKVDALNVSGKLLIEGTVFMRGRDPAVTRTFTVSTGGRVEFGLPLSAAMLSFFPTGSQEFTSAASVDINSSSILHADKVHVSGTWLARELDMSGPGWEELKVLGRGGKFFFETDEELIINKTVISGLLHTTSPVGSSAPLRGTTFTVETGGQVTMHYQGPPLGLGQGAVNSTMIMSSVLINGTFQAGSLYVESDDFVVGATGLLTVDGGGSRGGEGPGAGTHSSSGGSGASHGGRGGRGAGTRALHLGYGSIFAAGSWGSGGGMGVSSSGGGRGGGRIQLEVRNRLEINGRIQLNGLPGQVSDFALQLAVRIFWLSSSQGKSQQRAS